MSVHALITDDSPFMRKIIRHHLEQLGCHVVGEADNGKQAIRLVDQLEPHLVTLDVMMPESDGLDTLTTLRVIKNIRPRVAVVVVSAVSFDKTRHTFLDEGALAYIIKPLNKYSFQQVRPHLFRLFPRLLAQ